MHSEIRGEFEYLELTICTMVADERRIECNVKSAMLNVGNPPMPIGPTMAAQSCARKE
jgi:hypothetical protein